MSSPKTVEKDATLLSENENLVENSNLSKNSALEVTNEKEDPSSNLDASNSNNADSIQAPTTGVSDTAGNNNALPSPWSALWDTNYNCYYYWNSETNETTYTPPNSVANDSIVSDPQNNANSSVTAEGAKNSAETPGSNATDYSKYYYPNQSADANSMYSSYYPYYQPYGNPVHSATDPEYAEFMSKEYGFDPANMSDVRVTGKFNAKTGMFQSDDTLTPEKFSQENKAIRQCNAFFDYDSYIEQRGQQKSMYYNNLAVPKQPKLPKKTLEKLKRMKKEKKLESKKKWLRD